MITIIPDIHGRVFWKKAVDSMDFKKSNPERVVLLLGNHLSANISVFRIPSRVALPRNYIKY